MNDNNETVEKIIRVNEKECLAAMSKNDMSETVINLLKKSGLVEASALVANELAAHKREIESLKWKVENYAQVVAAKDAEIAKLKADVQELHDALREAVIETCHNHACCGGAPEYKCNGVDGNCFVKRCRAALAKAEGEEVEK